MERNYYKTKSDAKDSFSNYENSLMEVRKMIRKIIKEESEGAGQKISVRKQLINFVEENFDVIKKNIKESEINHIENKDFVDDDKEENDSEIEDAIYRFNVKFKKIKTARELIDLINDSFSYIDSKLYDTDDWRGEDPTNLFKFIKKLKK
jgi:hypothetical protein